MRGDETAPAELRPLVEALDDERLGQELAALAAELFPICRSITGEGLRSSLRILQRVAGIELTEVPSGTRVLDWTVPPEWNVREAWIRGPRGDTVVDFRRSNLHLVSGSAPFRGRLSLEALRPHLHSLPDRPSLVPHRTAYFREGWGFCLPHEQLQRLEPGEYEVLVDTTLRADGSLTYGERVVRGASADEVLVSCHCCHPSLANDNVSGMVVAATLARLLSTVRPRLTYRFVFVPATIGSIAWLARNEDRLDAIRHGLVVACVGDPGPMTYKRSRRGDAEVDRAAVHVLSTAGEPFSVREFSPVGYDERQYCSPGFDLPVGSLTRTPHGEFPQYHTSADDLGFIRASSLAASVRRYLEVFEVLEGNGTYRNLSPKGEPQLGRRGLYDGLGGPRYGSASQLAVLWVLNQSDGSRSLLDIAERARLPFHVVRSAADALERCGLLRAEQPPAPGVRRSR